MTFHKHKYLVTGGSGFIGSHLIKRLIQYDVNLINIDIKPPQLHEQRSLWRECDIKNMVKLSAIFDEILPTHVIHLAAKANLTGKSIDDFPDNTVGTSNVVTCVNKTENIKMFVNTSTQYVVRPGMLPKSDTQLIPYTAYGESKAEAERIVRSNCKRCWVIIRPTNIWGPLHPNFPYELWKYLRLRYYIHPGFKPIKKYYGYVDNAVSQLLSITMTSDPASYCGRVFYITDAPIDNAEWMNGFSVALSGKEMRRLPLQVWCMLAKVGDLVNKTGVRFPVTSERLFRLTVNERIPEDLTIKLPKSEQVTLEQGIRRSVDWYRSNVLKEAKHNV